MVREAKKATPQRKRDAGLRRMWKPLIGAEALKIQLAILRHNRMAFLEQARNQIRF
jgi:hypothetical protein